MKLKEEVYNIIANVFNIPLSEIDGDARLIEEMGADSMDMLTIVVHLEKHFEIAIKTEDMLTFMTPNCIVNYVKGAAVHGNDRHSDKVAP